METPVHFHSAMLTSFENHVLQPLLSLTVKKWPEGVWLDGRARKVALEQWMPSQKRSYKKQKSQKGRCPSPIH